MTWEFNDPQVGPMVLTFTGIVDGANMEGTVDFGGFASGRWAAVKNSPLPLSHELVARSRMHFPETRHRPCSRRRK